MTKFNLIILYLLVFLSLSILLNLTGVIDVKSSEIISYCLIFFGGSAVYLSMGMDKRGMLFSGSVAFLSGIVLFIFNNFEFTDPQKLILPSLLLIPAVSVVLLYIDGVRSNVLNVIFIVLLSGGLLLTYFSGNPGISTFFRSVINITGKYWPVAAILAGIILLLGRKES